jgi:hypothetical protein
VGVLFIDVQRWPEFMPGGMEIKEVTGPIDQVGTRVLSTARFLGRKMEGWDEVVEVDDRGRVRAQARAVRPDVMVQTS